MLVFYPMIVQVKEWVSVHFAPSLMLFSIYRDKGIPDNSATRGVILSFFTGMVNLGFVVESITWYSPYISFLSFFSVAVIGEEKDITWYISPELDYFHALILWPVQSNYLLVEKCVCCIWSTPALDK